MIVILVFCVLAFSLLYASLLALRLRLERIHRHVEQLALDQNV